MNTPPARRRALRIATASAVLLICLVVLRVTERLNVLQPRVDVPESFLPEPEWLATVPPVAIDSAADVSALWQSEPRCCTDDDTLQAAARKFHAACHHAIARHADDDELVTLCLYLLGDAVPRTDRRRLHEILIERYFYHAQDTSNCANCAPADRIARSAQSLAALYAQDADAASAVALLHRVLDARRDATSPWVQVELLTDLARYYRAVPPDPARQQSLAGAIARFASEARHDDTIASRLPALQRAVQPILAAD